MTFPKSMIASLAQWRERERDERKEREAKAASEAAKMQADHLAVMARVKDGLRRQFG